MAYAGATAGKVDAYFPSQYYLFEVGLGMIGQAPNAIRDREDRL